MKAGVFELATTSLKPLDVVLLELSDSNEDLRRLKTSEVEALGIEMSVRCRYGFRADCQLG